MDAMTTRVRRGFGQAMSPRDDEGFTLIEALVAMTNSMRQTQGISTATDEARFAFQRLDKQVRYAKVINAPGVGNDNTGWYVEMRMEDARVDNNPAENGPNKKDICQQWRVLPSGRIQSRRWELNPNTNNMIPSSNTNWVNVGTGVTNKLTGPDAQLPFALVAPTGAVGVASRQGLRLDVHTQRNRKNGAGQLTATFISRNTDLSVPPCSSTFRS